MYQFVSGCQVWGCRGSVLALPTFCKLCFGIAFELYFRGCFRISISVLLSSSAFGMVFQFHFRCCHQFSLPASSLRLIFDGSISISYSWIPDCKLERANSCRFIGDCMICFKKKKDEFSNECLDLPLQNFWEKRKPVAEFSIYD